MPQPGQERHPFLDDLTEDAVLVSSVLRAPVAGRAAVRRVVEEVGRLYATQNPIFAAAAGPRLILEYEAVLASGETLGAAAIVTRNADGSVPFVSVRMSPLGAVLVLAAHLRAGLAGALPEELFL